MYLISRTIVVDNATKNKKSNQYVYSRHIFIYVTICVFSKIHISTYVYEDIYMYVHRDLHMNLCVHRSVDYICINIHIVIAESIKQTQKNIKKKMKLMLWTTSITKLLNETTSEIQQEARPLFHLPHQCFLFLTAFCIFFQGIL
jgi:hypothetical protein